MTTVGHIRNELLGLFRRNAKVNYSVASLQRALKLRDSADIKNMVTALNGLMKESFIHQNEQEQYSLGAPKAVIVGTFRGNDKGFGFVSVDDSTDRMCLSPHQTRSTLLTGIRLKSTSCTQPNRVIRGGLMAK